MMRRRAVAAPAWANGTSWSRRASWSDDLLVTTVSSAVFVLTGAVIGLRLGEAGSSVPTALALAAVVGLGAIVFAVIVTPLAALSAAFALLAVVIVEPAPVDLVFVVLIGFSLVARAVEPLMPGFIGLLLAL